MKGAGCLLSLAMQAPPPPTVEIEWDAPSSCPDRAWVERRVVKFLDRPTMDGAVEPVRVSVTVVADESGATARLTLRTGAREQQRTLNDENCEVLAAASAFIIAVAIDPEAALAEPDGLETESAPEGEPALEDDSTATARRDEPALRRSVRVPRGAIRVQGSGGGGVLPGFAPGVGLVGAFLVGRARIELAGAWHFQRTVDLGAPRSATVQLWEVAASGCFSPSAGPVEFPLCGGLGAGAMRGRSRGIAEPAEAAIPWIAARVGPGLAFVPSRFAAIRLGVDALIPLQRPRFTIENVGVVHESWPVAVLGTLGAEVRFP